MKCLSQQLFCSAKWTADRLQVNFFYLLSKNDLRFMCLSLKSKVNVEENSVNNKNIFKNKNKKLIQ